MGGTEEEIEAVCERLAQRGQFIAERELETWPDGTVSGRYGFRHALYQEVLYQRLSASRRVRLHQQIARRSNNAMPPADAAPMPHARLCWRNSPIIFSKPRREDRQFDKAITYARQAGKHAMSVLAYEDAVRHFERALQALARHGADDPRRCELLLALGEAQRGRGPFLGAGHLSTGRGARAHAYAHGARDMALGC